MSRNLSRRKPRRNQAKYHGRLPQLAVENLEARVLLAADLASLSPADGAAAVDADANLVLTFSEDVQKGPGTGNIVIRNGDNGALVEAVNVNSDRVTFDGATVTVDPVNDLAENSFYYAEVDASAIRDTSGDATTSVLMAEDFEDLQLQDSGLATDDILIDANNYVVVMSGVLDVKVAGDYTFGINADDGQRLAIDVAQDGFDNFDDEIIFDNTTHGNQDRLHVCGIEDAVQNCEGSSFEDPITLAVGEYPFEMWYFEAGGGSSGEFFYAPGLQEIWDPAEFRLIGDDSQGIGVTADGITATTYASTGAIGDFGAAEAAVDGVDLATGFPASATIPTADVWNTGGNGRFMDNHPVPGFPAPTFGDGTDWTDEGPVGWTRDNSNLLTEDANGATGTPEYAGWTFLDKYFWINQQGNQNRLAYTKGENVVAVVDPDAYDDFIEIGPDSAPDPDGDGVRDASFFDAGLSSAPIYLDGVAENSTTLTFDSSWRDEDFQTAVVSVEYFDADGNSVSSNELLRWESQAGPNFHDDMEDETVELDLQNPAGTASMIITWDMPVAANDWWWAIDNIVVEGTVAGNTFAGIDGAEDWDFNTFGAATIGFEGSVSIDEDGGDVTLTVIRQGVTDAAVSVDYATSNFTASSDDYTAASGTLDFAAGETEKTFTVSVVDDDVAEADEYVNVILSNPGGGAEFGALASVITIVDNDRSVIVFQEGVEITIDGVGTGVTYTGTTDADPAGASGDDVRDRPELNPDGEDGGEEVHGLTKFDNLFGDGAGLIGADSVVAGATLTFNITNEGTPLTVHRLLFEFNQEELTWNELTFNGNTDPGLQADGLEATAALRQFDTMPAMVTNVDVSDDVKAWKSGEAENFGWGFLPTGTNGVDWDSAEAAEPTVRPKLTVEFVNLAAEPSDLADVTAPGDALIRVDGQNDGDANDGAPPPTETVDHVIDDVTQKHLNFLDLNSGFIVTPSAGASLVQGLRLYTANDGPERDPASYVLEGGNDTENFTVISEGVLALPEGRNDGGDIPIDTSLNFQEILFPNTDVYSSYRLTFPTVKDAEASCCMQIAEVEFLGQAIADSGDQSPSIDLSAGTAAQSTQLSGFVAENALDDVVNFTHTDAADENPTWQVVLPASYAFDAVTVYNRGASEGSLSCCPSRLRDITIQVVNFSGDVTADFTGGTVVASSDLLNPENVLGGGTNTDGPISVSNDFGGAVGNLIRVIRTTDPDLSGTGGEGNADEGSVLSIDLVEATGTQASAPPLVGDIDGDGTVGFSDFLILSASFGQDVDPAGSEGDIDGDGTVGFPDFLLLSANFGATSGAAPMAAAVDAALAGDDDDDFVTL